MAIVTNTNLNKAPYWEDYDQDKKFIKVLFRPGVSVQARELTQLQTMMQKQIERFGRHMFKENSMIVPGIIQVDLNYTYVKIYKVVVDELGVPIPGNVPLDIENLLDMNVEEVRSGATNLIKGKIKEFVAYTDPVLPYRQCYLMYLRYTGVGDLNKKVFPASCILKITDKNDVLQCYAKAVSVLDNATSDSGITGKGSITYIGDGVYFTKGYFAKVSKQKIFLSYFDPLPSYRAGLKVVESIITEKDDPSLLSNAKNTPNYAAPGAHRLKLDLILDKIVLEETEDPQTAATDSSFIELLVVRDGIVYRRVTKTDYNILGDTLARRTYDESGDYTVKPFLLNVKECLNTGTNGGVKQKTLVLDDLTMVTSPDIHDISEVDKTCSIEQTIGGDTATASIYSFNSSVNRLQYIQTSISNLIASSTEKINIFNSDSDKIADAIITEVIGEDYIDKFAVKLNPGKAYVKGYEIETIAPTILAVNKARDTGEANNQVISTFHGNAFSIVDVTGIPSFDQFESIDIYNDRYTSTSHRLIIGTCKAKQMICTATQPAGHVAAEYFLSIFDVKMKPNQKIESAKSFEKGNFKANISCATYRYVGNITLTPDTGTALGHIQIEGAQNILGTVANVYDVIVLNSGDSANYELIRIEVVTSPFVGRYSIWNGTTWNLAPTGDPLKDTHIDIEYAEPFLGYNNALLFEAPHANLKELQNVEQQSGLDNKYTIFKIYSGVTYWNGSANIIEITTGSADQFDISDKSHDIIIQLGAVLVTPLNVVESLGNTKLTITVASSGNYKISAPIIQLDSGSAAYRTKELKISHKDFITPTEYENQILKLDRVDITKILYIWMAKSGEALPAYSIDPSHYTACVDIKSNYSLDSGQRDNYYDRAKLLRRTGSNNPAGAIRIIYNYYEHGMLQNPYYCVNSYFPATQNLPVYISSYGRKYNLRDCLDFRPDYTEFNDPLHPIKLPAATKNFTADYEYYLNRIDKVCLNTEGRFEIVQGKPAIDPKAPETPNNTMALYTLEIPAYTNTAKDVTPKFIENKRYTMRDIGKLEQRIENVEYYTSLSLLEKETRDMVIQDADGFDRHSVGFIVDPFTDDIRTDVSNKDKTCMGDRLSTDFRCCYDPPNKLMRPVFKDLHVNLIETDWSESQLTLTSDGAILITYDEVLMTEQPFVTTTININPFDVFVSEGVLKLTPSIDTFTITQVVDKEIINIDTGAYDQLSDLTKNMGHVWNDWTTTWTGFDETDAGNQDDAGLEDKTVVGYNFEIIGDIYKDPKIQGNGKLQREKLLEKVNEARKKFHLGPVSKLPHPKRFIYSRTTTTAHEGNTHKDGVEFSVREGDPITYSLGNKVISSSPAQLMRSIIIKFNGTQMTPGDRVYPFFDGVDVSEYCSSQIVEANGSTVPVTRIKKNSELANVQNLTVKTSPAAVKGNIEGWFQIPEADKVDAKYRFPVGQRVLRLTSKDGNDPSGDRASSIAEAPFYATGIVQQVQETIVSIRNPEIVSTPIQSDEPTSYEDTDTTTWYGPWADPVAQNFQITNGSNQENTGVFVTSIDLYFKTKSVDQPVTIQIVETINGVPSVKQPAFASVIKEAIDVSTVVYSKTEDPDITKADSELDEIDDGATRFTFSTPIYLLNNTLYAFVVSSPKSNEYNLNIGHVQTSEGEPEESATTTNHIILFPESAKGNLLASYPPGIDAFFISRNHASWSIDQSKIVKFKIWKAKFGSGGAITATDDVTESREYMMGLPNNPVQINRDLISKVIYIHQPDHGFRNLDRVSLFGLTGMEKNVSGWMDIGVREEVTVTTYGGLAVDLDGYYATTTNEWRYKNNDTFSGRMGGSSVSASRQKKFDVMCINAGGVTPAGTNLTYSCKTRSYNNPHNLTTVPIVTIAENYEFEEPQIILSPDPQNHIGDYSMEVTVGLSSSNPDVSPIFDMSSLGAIVISNRINNLARPTNTSDPINYYNILDAVTMPMTGSQTVIFTANTDTISIPTNNGSLAEEYDNRFYVGKYIKCTSTDAGFPAINKGPYMILKKVYDDSNSNKYFVLTVQANLTDHNAKSGEDLTIAQHEYYIDEIAPIDGSAAAKWPSLRVQLKNPATALYVEFAAYRPASVTVELYYKVKLMGDNREMNDIEYSLATLPSNETPSPSVIDGDYKDYKYDIKIGDSFDLFVCKIVMKQDISDSCLVPKIKDFRAKALAE